MALSIEHIGEIDQVVGDWCLARVPAHLKQSVDYDYEIDGQAVTILEVRPAWRGTPGEVTRRPIARFRFVKVTGFGKSSGCEQAVNGTRMNPCSRSMIWSMH